MRKLILIAGFVLASATAQAGDNRSLSLSGSDVLITTAPAPAKATDASQTAEVPQVAVAPKAEAPKYVERPALVETKAEQASTDSTKPVATKTASTPKAEKPRRQRYWTEARIINELHRHGIYW